MIIATSLLQTLLDAQPQLRSQIYFKSSLTALSHAMEDQVLASTDDRPLVIACFQRERFYRQEAHRYLRIAQRSSQVYVLAAPETEFENASGPYESIAFDPEDGLSQEWHLVVMGQQYAICLLCREVPVTEDSAVAQTDQARRFEGIWTFDRQVSYQAAQLMLNRISLYRPELKPKIKKAVAQLDGESDNGFNHIDPAPFADRLVTYLQAGQYRQQKAYRQIATQERKERLVNLMTTAIRQSLNPDQILQEAAQELGEALKSHRCIIYQCQDTDQTAQVQYEFTGPGQVSLLTQTWSLQNNPWFQRVAEHQERVYVEDVPSLVKNKALKAQMKQAQLRSLLMVPVLYQGHLLGMVELHHTEIYTWSEPEISMVDAIASQIGVALIQAQSFADLETLNQQLEGLERTRSNLIAITGHELRTPLSTIQVCLESLANEPDMPAELQQVMLTTALSDAERMRKLIQDFLTLSRLESGRINSNPEPLALQECVDLALSRVRTHPAETQIPTISVQLPDDLPLVKADGEWLVEVLAKLLDNACKFTPAKGQIALAAQPTIDHMLEVSITDTGRGIEPERLETVFDRFYQEEGALRRTTGGTGLGLAICRQIIQNLGGAIRATSPGKDQGSTFYFTLPVALGAPSNGTQRGKASPEEL
jgi:DICT domain-containing protein/GAF domain-containing protein